MDLSGIYKHFPNLTLTWAVTYVVFAYLAVYAVYKVLIYPRFLCPLRHLAAAPQDSWLLGNGPSMFREPPGFNLLEWMLKIPNHGLIHFHGFFNLRSLLLVTTPESLAEVLNHHPYDYVKPPEARNFLAKILGNGLVTVEGAEHKFQRKKVTPAFHGKHIKELFPMFWGKAVDLTDEIAASLYTCDSIVEMKGWASRATLDIIGVAGLGRNFNALKDPEGELIKQYELLTTPTREGLIYFSLNMLLPQWFVSNLPWKVSRMMNEATAAVRAMCSNLVQEKKAAVKSQTEQQVDILSVLLRTDEFSDDMLVDQLLTFLAAGHETTSSALTWSLYLLSINPQMQERLRDEVHKCIPDRSRTGPVTSDTIEGMQYLSAVCNEVLRLYPTVPATARRTIRDTPILGQVVPKGTGVVIPMWAINRSPSLWGNDADKFKPERFMAEGAAANGGSNTPYAQLTFLHGPRSCIGQGFAKAELKCLLAALVGRFAFEMADKNEIILPSGAITIKPKNGLRLRLRELKSASH